MEQTKAQQAVELWKRLRAIADQAALDRFSLLEPYSASRVYTNRAGKWLQRIQIICENEEEDDLWINELGLAGSETLPPIVAISHSLGNSSKNRMVFIRFGDPTKAVEVKRVSTKMVVRQPLRGELKLLHRIIDCTRLTEEILAFGRDDFLHQVSIGLGEYPDREGIWIENTDIARGWQLFQYGFDEFFDGLEEVASGYSPERDEVKRRKYYQLIRQFCVTQFPPAIQPKQ